MLVSLTLPPTAFGWDDDCPALDGASLGLRGNKLAFNDGCIANSRIERNLKFDGSAISDVSKHSPCSVKLNSGGNSRPFGKTLLPSRSSLKKG